MKITELFAFTIKNFILAKRLFWFAFNVCTFLPPFRQLHSLFNITKEKLKRLQKTIIEIGKSNSPLNFICQVYKQSLVVFTIVIALALCAYVRVFKNNKSSHIKETQNPLKQYNQLEDIKEKAILPKRFMENPQEKQEVDSCCEQLHKNLNGNMKKEDKIFLEILRRYQGIDAEDEEPPKFHRFFSELQSNTNKQAFDNSSTEQGYMKTSLKNMPQSPRGKREDDLNRSSVL